MLTALHIRDFAIIDEIEVSFGPGLNIMTGETGAGKTIIVEALNLVLGARARTDLIRAGSDHASVTAVFDAKRIPSGLRRDLENAGIDCGDELIVRRVVSGGGKGRIFISGVPMTGASLKNIVERLVDVSSQHEHQLLLDRNEHVAILDLFGGQPGCLEEYRSIHEKFIRLNEELTRLERNEREAKEKLDFLKFQLKEIKSINPKPGELDEIETNRSRLRHAVTLEEKTRAADAILYRNSGSVVEQLDGALQLLAECSCHDPTIAGWSEGLDRARAEIEDVARGLSRYAESLESDPDALEAMEERLHLIKRLIRKQGGSIEECLSRAGKIESEIDTISNYDDVLAQKKVELDSLAKERRASASRLSESRKTAASDMSEKVEKELNDLGMAKTEFSVAMERLSEDQWDDNGPDAVEFLIAPNVGEPAKPLVRIASGGELSRVMLAIKGVLADRAGLTETSIYDEVDNGIGGAVAEVVGKKLKGVSRMRQIICITHLPQIAVYGDNHIRISKHVKKGRTVTILENLPSDGRVEEIARMLGGEKITDTTRVHAGEMLQCACNSSGRRTKS